MRATYETDSIQFANFLQDIGSGNIPATEFEITIPDQFRMEDGKISSLCNFVFENIHSNYKDAAWLASRAIIVPTNAAADESNTIITNTLPGDPKQYRSTDSVTGSEYEYPIDFINNPNPSGLPPHKLTLKVNSIIILLRNFDPVNGHCNGTRYRVTALHSHVIDAVIATGPNKGERLHIPRIPLKPSDHDFPFQMTRKQFPVKPAFAITANKSQGQTLQKVGIYLPTPMFSHGQLYVAMSRATAADNLKILSDGTTANVVYEEVL